MRKNQEGYVLVYVAVVVAVLTVLGVAVCSAAVQNLQAQQAAAEALRSRLTAEGAVERAVALLRGETTEITIEKPFLDADPTNESHKPTIDEVYAPIDGETYGEFAYSVSSDMGDDERLSVELGTWTGTTANYTISWDDGETTLEATVSIRLQAGEPTYTAPPVGSESTSTHKYTYTVTVKTVEYTAYRVA